MFDYPSTGYHFAVYFHGLLPNPVDAGFQSVSGLSVTVNTAEYPEGGENRFVHKMPTGLKFETLKLKRGLKAAPSPLRTWCKQVYEKFAFQPLDLVIVLMNEKHIPLQSWMVVGAYPIKYEISDFNAEEAKIVIESLELNYQYFKTIT